MSRYESCLEDASIMCFGPGDGGVRTCPDRRVTTQAVEYINVLYFTFSVTTQPNSFSKMVKDEGSHGIALSG